MIMFEMNLTICNEIDLNVVGVEMHDNPSDPAAFVAYAEMIHARVDVMLAATMPSIANHVIVDDIIFHPADAHTDAYHEIKLTYEP